MAAPFPELEPLAVAPVSCPNFLGSLPFHLMDLRKAHFGAFHRLH